MTRSRGTAPETGQPRRAAQRLRLLVDALLDVARAEADRPHPRREATDVAALTAECVGMFRSAAHLVTAQSSAAASSAAVLATNELSPAAAWSGFVVRTARTTGVPSGVQAMPTSLLVP